MRLCFLSGGGFLGVAFAMGRHPTYACWAFVGVPVMPRRVIPAHACILRAPVLAAGVGADGAVFVGGAFS